MRLIDADALTEKYGDWYTEEGTEEGYIGTIKGIVESMPTIEERKKGKWIDYTDEGYVECPFCHSATNCEDNKDELHYCFSCGARLESGT